MVFHHFSEQKLCLVWHIYIYACSTDNCRLLAQLQNTRFFWVNYTEHKSGVHYMYAQILYLSAGAHPFAAEILDC
jgi:hypothetical protein